MNRMNRVTEPPARNGLRMGACLTLAIVIALAAPQRAWADEESPALAQYREKVDKSVDKALAYLAKQQEKDGSFRSGMPQNTGITSLAVMAFLAKGYTPGNGPYGDVINKGIDFVLASEKNGMLLGRSESHGPMYSHCIATLMLSEVSGMVDPERQKKVDKALGKALEVILAAQKVRKPAQMQGGWRYQNSSNDADISCTGWALMSLRSARNNGADAPKEAIKEAVKFVMNCRHSSGGFCYQPGGDPGMARTGTALLCLELSGMHGDKVTTQAGDWVLAHLPNRFGGVEHFYYGMYYCAQGMFQLGGKYWENFAKFMYDMMLKYQKEDGSWPTGGGNEDRAGPCYATAMGVLAIGVAYRQLPIYQR